MNEIDFSKSLLAWFDDHGRHDLPWQTDCGPYRVWISEIMLQQTQVDTVIPYFNRFIDRFPTVKQLADTDIDNVLFAWSGLGYYARARNLHKTARIIEYDQGGRFPDTLDELMGLPGIGRSTAGAICSLAFGKRAAILDGNVKRVLSRYAELDGWPGSSRNMKMLWSLSDRYTPGVRIADYTQAIMDLGATVCTRGKPDCLACPLSNGCGAYLSDRTHEIPAAKPKRTRPTRQTTMIMVTDRQSRVLLKRKPTNGVWGGLWVFPEVEHRDAVGHWCESELGLREPCIDHWPDLRHRFTHFDLDIHPVRIVAETLKDNAVSEGIVAGKEWVWYNTRSPQAIGLAKPVSRLLDELARHGETK